MNSYPMVKDLFHFLSDRLPKWKEGFVNWLRNKIYGLIAQMIMDDIVVELSSDSDQLWNEFKIAYRELDKLKEKQKAIEEKIRKLENKQEESLPTSFAFVETLKRALCRSRGAFCNGCKEAYPLSELTINYIIPLSEGGTDNEPNHQLLCSSCNKLIGGNPMDGLLAEQ